MPTNLIPGSDVFTFGGLELHGTLQSIGDAHGFRLVVHEFLKRDGGLVEVMGRRPHMADIELHFVGANFRAKLTEFLALLDENPKRLLVHPLLGQYVAACTVPRASLNVIEAANTCAVQASFTESALDQRTEEAATVQGARADVLTLGESLLTLAAGYATALPSIETYVATSTAYAEAAATSDETSTADPALDAQLGQVATEAATASAALLADPAAPSEASTADAGALIERVYASCLDLADALRETRPLAVRYQVPAPASVAGLLQALYGAEAMTYLDALLAMNEIANPARITAGTILTLPAAPTVST